MAALLFTDSIQIVDGIVNRANERELRGWYDALVSRLDQDARALAGMAGQLDIKLRVAQGCLVTSSQISVGKPGRILPSSNKKTARGAHAVLADFATRFPPFAKQPA